MKKLFKLLKGSPIAMIVAGVLIAGIASAALLTVYVTMLGEGNVEQSVVFGNGDIDKTYTIGDSPAIAGNTYTQDYNLMNKSETTAPIKFVTNQCIVGGGHCSDTDHNEDGVETSYWSTLVLENKNTDWEIQDADGIKATLTYNLVANDFEYKLEASELDISTDYSLVYYADKQDRFVDYGGNNPGALIVKIKTDSDGNISTEGSVNLKMNLPAPEDWNASSEANYCTNDENDNYNLCRGAKIWLVPSTDYNATSKKIKDASWANVGKFLFETDLITYNDLGKGEGLNLGEGKLNFFVKNVLDIALAPGEYKVKTEVQPVQ